MYVLDAAGKRISDHRRRPDVGRTRDKEPARHDLSVDALLDREQQIGGPLDLVDDGRPRHHRDHPRRVCPRGVPRGRVVEGDVGGGVVGPDEIPHERRLAGLPRSEYGHHSRLGEGFEEQRGDRARHEARLCATATVVALGRRPGWREHGRSGVEASADRELRPRQIGSSGIGKSGSYAPLGAGQPRRADVGQAGQAVGGSGAGVHPGQRGGATGPGGSPRVSSAVRTSSKVSQGRYGTPSRSQIDTRASLANTTSA